MKIFSEQLKELKNCLSLFPGSYDSKNMEDEELNDGLIQAIPNGWSNQAYIQGWDVEVSTYCKTHNIFDWI